MHLGHTYDAAGNGARHLFLSRPLRSDVFDPAPNGRHDGNGIKAPTEGVRFWRRV